MSRSALLVVAETRQDLASPLTRELLGLARELASTSDAEVAALLVAKSETAVPDLIAHGADRVYFCEQPGADEYEGERWVGIAERVARELAPAAILAGHTP